MKGYDLVKNKNLLKNSGLKLKKGYSTSFQGMLSMYFFNKNVSY